MVPCFSAYLVLCIVLAVLCTGVCAFARFEPLAPPAGGEGLSVGLFSLVVSFLWFALLFAPAWPLSVLVLVAGMRVAVVVSSGGLFSGVGVVGVFCWVLCSFLFRLIPGLWFR